MTHVLRLSPGGTEELMWSRTGIDRAARGIVDATMIVSLRNISINMSIGYEDYESYGSGRELYSRARACMTC